MQNITNTVVDPATTIFNPFPYGGSNKKGVAIIRTAAAKLIPKMEKAKTLFI